MELCEQGYWRITCLDQCYLGCNVTRPFFREVLKDCSEKLFYAGKPQFASQIDDLLRNLEK